MSVIIDNITYFTGPLYTSTIISNNNISIINTNKNVNIITNNSSCTNLITNNLKIANISSNNTYIELKTPYNIITSILTYNPIANINISTTKNYYINFSSYQHPDVFMDTAISGVYPADKYVRQDFFTLNQTGEYNIAYIRIYNFGVYLVYYNYILYQSASTPSNAYNLVDTYVSSNSLNNSYIMGTKFTEVPISNNTTYSQDYYPSNMGIFNITAHPSGSNYSTLTLYLKFYYGSTPSVKLNFLNTALDINSSSIHFYAIKLS
jgi:hypothetical protein